LSGESGTIYLNFKLDGGACVTLSPEMISGQLAAAGVEGVDAEFVREAALAVFHYFKNELGLQTTTLDQFADAVTRVVRGFNHRPVHASGRPKPGTDLHRLAAESGEGGELVFFPRLREELRRQLRESQPVLRFSGLRECVKRLAGAKRWGHACGRIEDQIVMYLRRCLCAEARRADLQMVVD
jgi:hypothetical protein